MNPPIIGIIYMGEGVRMNGNQVPRKPVGRFQEALAEGAGA